MKYIYLVAALAMTGCVTPRTCELKTQRAVGKVLLEDQQDMQEAVDQVNTSWKLTLDLEDRAIIRQFCFIVIDDAMQISKLKKTNKLSLPNVCGPLYEELLKKK